MTEDRFSTLSDIVDRSIEIDKERKALSKESVRLLKSGAKLFFKENPEVASVNFIAYAPYFNDGDACVFHVNEVVLHLTVDAAKEFGIARTQDDEELDSSMFWEGDDAFLRVSKNARAKEIYKSFGLFASLIDDESAKQLGDSIQVTITKKGFQVDTHEHE